MAKVTLFFRGQILLSQPLEQEITLIGRSPECHIQIDSLAVAEQHASIEAINDSFWIRCHSERCMVQINQQPVEQKQLAHGDLIQIGKHTLGFSEMARTLAFTRPQPTEASPDREVTASLEMDSETEQAEEETERTRFDQVVERLHNLPSACIQVLNGEHLGKIIPLQRGLTRLGMRGSECAVIAHRHDGYYLSHLEGRRVPMVAGRRIGDSATRIRHGDVLQVGDIQMRFFEEISRAAAI